MPLQVGRNAAVSTSPVVLRDHIRKGGELNVLESLCDRLLGAVVPERQAAADECGYQYRCWMTNCHGCPPGGCIGGRTTHWTQHRRMICAGGYVGRYVVTYCGSCTHSNN
jgi:hypothetical protein